MKGTASVPVGGSAIGEELIDSRQAARKLRCSVRHLDSQRAAGNVPFIRIGNLVRFSPSALDEWVREQLTPDCQQEQQVEGGES